MVNTASEVDAVGAGDERDDDADAGVSAVDGLVDCASFSGVAKETTRSDDFTNSEAEADSSSDSSLDTSTFSSCTSTRSSSGDFIILPLALPLIF